MPELPEVQSLVDLLNKHLQKRKVVDFWLAPKSKMILKEPFNSFTKKIRGRKLIHFHRLGKYIVTELDNGAHLAVHLKMTGHFFLGSWQTPLPALKVDRFIRAIFFLDKGKTLAFSDIRKFGKIFVLTKETEPVKTLGIGPDALSVTEKELATILHSSSQKIKQVLMDAKRIGGIGNIYANEILFGAKVSPLRRANSLKPAELKKVFAALQKILRKAVAYRGTSAEFDRSWKVLDGSQGGYQRFLKVYGKTKCPQCGKKLRRVAISQRSSWFCKNCQK